MLSIGPHRDREAHACEFDMLDLAGEIDGCRDDLANISGKLKADHECGAGQPPSREQYAAFNALVLAIAKMKEVM